MNDDFKAWFIKYLWPALNTVMFVMLFFYLFITNDINTRCVEKVEEFELKIDNHEKMIDFLIEANKQKSNRDTIVITIETNKINKTNK